LANFAHYAEVVLAPGISLICRFAIPPHRLGVKLDFIRPGKPVENAYIESFNGRLRQECLEENWFTSLEDAKRKIEAWRKDYNEHRPHSSLGDETPQGFAESWELSRTAKTAGILT
jgi:putative transposase